MVTWGDRAVSQGDLEEDSDLNHMHACLHPEPEMTHLRLLRPLGVGQEETLRVIYG